ncbi:MAG: cupin domain-containing protein [Cyanobacteria bacterium P01_F01_bin.56]
MTILPATAVSVETQPSRDRLTELGVFDWPIWTKEVSTFPWTYEESETCYFLAGEVIVTPDDGSPVKLGQGDLVRFSAGMSCTWEIRAAVKKHYTFGDE